MKEIPPQMVCICVLKVSQKTLNDLHKSFFFQFTRKIGAFMVAEPVLKSGPAFALQSNQSWKNSYA